MIDNEILDDYSNEARELLEEMDHSLMRLEQEGPSPELLNTIFRAVHCIKGSAEYIGLERSSTLTHGVENLLDRIREGITALDPRIVDFLFRAKDTIGMLIGEVSTSRSEKTEISGLLGELEAILHGAPTAEPETQAPESDIMSDEPIVTDEAEPAGATSPASPMAAAGGSVPSTTEAMGEGIEERVSPSPQVPGAGLPYDSPWEVFSSEILPGAHEGATVRSEPVAPLDSEMAAAGAEGTHDTPSLGDTDVQSPEPTAEHVAKLELTAPQILNVALYIDDLQDGVNPEEVMAALSNSLASLIRSLNELGLTEAVILLETMSSRLNAVDEGERLSAAQVDELRGFLDDLRSYYPEGFFPLQPTGVREPVSTAPLGNSHPADHYQEYPLYRELMRVPGLDSSLVQAIMDFGLTSREQLARVDQAALLRIAGMTSDKADTVLKAVGTVSTGASRKGKAPVKTEERSLLADVDDELLREFEGIFSAAGEDRMSLGGSPPLDPVVSELLGEIDTLGEDADREIIEIFLAYGWEIMEKLRQVVARIRPGNIRRNDLQACADLIKSIRSSSTYMDFQSLASFLDDWYEKTIWTLDNVETLAPNDCAFMDRNRLRFEDFLTGLDVVLNPSAAVVERPAGTAEATRAKAANQPPSPVMAWEQSAGLPGEDATLDRSAPTSGDDGVSTMDREPTAEVATLEIPTVEVPTVEREAPATEELPSQLGRVPEMASPRDLSQESAVVRTMRVDSAKVDVLLNQVGELVVNRSYVEQLSLELRTLYRELQAVPRVGKKELVTVKNLSLKVGEASLALGRVANDIQEGVMKLRMLPIGQLFNRMPRLIRDLSRRVGKSVALQVHGGDTEVDKRVIEQIYNPLVHLIRNAVDHGIEEPAVRKGRGKKEEGMVVLSAYSQGNQVVIDVEDDGGGIDAGAVIEKAVENHLIEPDDASKLGHLEVYNLLFIPGFSTSRKVTRTSGRGVGMDVVKKDVEKINGHVEVSSEEGEGTRISIKIPLTLAIIQTLLIKVGKHMFAIPLTSVREILLISPGDISTIEGFEVIKFREETIPILRVNEVFNLKDYDRTRQPKFLVLATAGLKTVGLLVEELIGEQDVVIKPLAEHVFESRGLAGSTILGDGTIALVLDVTEMIEDVIAQQRQIAASAGRLNHKAGRVMGLKA